jgi:hypothetical protein
MEAEDERLRPVWRDRRDFAHRSSNDPTRSASATGINTPLYYGSVLVDVIPPRAVAFLEPLVLRRQRAVAEPQVALLSPVYPLTSLMSLALAMKVNILLHYWAGFIGMHLILTRILGLSFADRRLSRLGLHAAGSLALHLNAEHSVFLPAFYLPLLLSFLRSLKTESVRDALLAGAVLALSSITGAAHRAHRARGPWRDGCRGRGRAPNLAAVALSVLNGVAGFCYAAPKLGPVILFVKEISSGTPGRARAFRLDDRPDVAARISRPLSDPEPARRQCAEARLVRYGNYVERSP